MSISDLKFKKGDFAGNDISSLPDRPGSIGITGKDLKERFDNIGKVMIALGKFNDIIDALLSTGEGKSGASNIGVAEIANATGLTVQEVLEALAAVKHSHSNKAELDSYTMNEEDLINSISKAATYVHEQQVPEAEWVIEHDLDNYPSVTVIDTSDTVVVGDIVYISNNKLKLTFCSAFAGKAYLN